MRLQRTVLSLTLALAGLTGCDVYERWDGEFSAGPVDAQNFPPEYLGTGANRQRAGSGSFTGRRAYAGEQPLGYYLFSFASGQLRAADPLAVRSNGKPTATAPTPLAYVFDPEAERPDCKRPEGYEFDAARDDVALDTQGHIFTALPTATYAPGAEPTYAYVPIVSQVPVAGNGIACQALKSEKTLVENQQKIGVELTEPVNGKQTGIPDGTFRAWAMIEPGAAVYRYTSTATAREPASGVGMQQWGWFNQYLVAYLDGGLVPTQEVTVNNVPVVRMVPQKLYYPRSQVREGTTNRTVTVGQGYDVVEAQRNAAGYSPVCQVFTYDAGGPLPPDQLPKSAAEVVTRYGATLRAPTKAFGDRSPVGDAYVYCLQIE